MIYLSKKAPTPFFFLSIRVWPPKPPTHFRNDFATQARAVDSVVWTTVIMPGAKPFDIGLAYHPINGATGLGSDNWCYLGAGFWAVVDTNTKQFNWQRVLFHLNQLTEAMEEPIRALAQDLGQLALVPQMKRLQGRRKLSASAVYSIIL
jgi:hypothetical protein